jgi:hypothetical protein
MTLKKTTLKKIFPPCKKRKKYLDVPSQLGSDPTENTVADIGLKMTKSSVPPSKSHGPVHTIHC